jgi:ASC-1-like (ASCH) protein
MEENIENLERNIRRYQVWYSKQRDTRYGTVNKEVPGMVQ